MQRLQDIREKYPQYNNLSDQDLADRLHAKFYSDMPKSDFHQKIGLQQQTIPTAFGNLPHPSQSGFMSRENVNELINASGGIGPGMAISGGLARGSVIPTKNSLIQSILKPHDALERAAAEKFQHVSGEVSKRGSSNMAINPNEIENLKQYFDKTRQSNKLLNDAKTGDYDALRKLQSDLYKKGKKNLQSDLETDRMRGAEMLEKRNDINSDISDSLRMQGHHDLADVLDAAKQDYSTLQKIYYNPNLPNALLKMVDKETRKIPENIAQILQEQSKPMNAFKAFHPELETNVNRYLTQNKLLFNPLSNAAIYGVPIYAAGKGIGAFTNSNPISNINNP